MFWLAIVTVVAATVLSFSPETARPFATMVTWCFQHETLTASCVSAGLFLMTRYVSQSLER
jgi:hypothetical protein